MVDIVERLREMWRDITGSDGGESEQMEMTRIAADTIDRQREEIGRLREALAPVESWLQYAYGHVSSVTSEKVKAHLPKIRSALSDTTEQDT